MKLFCSLMLPADQIDVVLPVCGGFQNVCGTLTLLALLWQVIFEWLDPVAASQYSNPYPSLLLALTGEIIVLLINVYVSGWVAGAILSWLLTTASNRSGGRYFR
jgi:hypothetical protein